MPCRRPGGERLLLLQNGGEVDALVARLGEVLQLSAAQKPPPPPAACDPPRLLVAPKRDRAAPYASFFAASFHQHSGKQLCGRGWLRRRRRSPKRHLPRCPLQEGAGGGGGGGSDDPHRLLQQLILSGNLIKEAVRRLQRAASVGPAPAGEGSPSPDSSAASSSSAGSWCPSSGGEEEGASP